MFSFRYIVIKHELAAVTTQRSNIFKLGSYRFYGPFRRENSGNATSDPIPAWIRCEEPDFPSGHFHHNQFGGASDEATILDFLSLLFSLLGGSGISDSLSESSFQPSISLGFSDRILIISSRARGIP